MYVTFVINGDLYYYCFTLYFYVIQSNNIGIWEKSLICTNQWGYSPWKISAGYGTSSWVSSCCGNDLILLKLLFFHLCTEIFIWPYYIIIWSLNFCSLTGPGRAMEMWYYRLWHSNTILPITRGGTWKLILQQPPKKLRAQTSLAPSMWTHWILG